MTSELPASVQRLELEDREVFLVGTAHVSPQSVRDTNETIEAIEPDTVCVELCEARYQNLENQESWRKLDIFQVLREGKAALLLSSFLMHSFQRRIAQRFGIEPGAEMRAAIAQARDRGARLELIDRDIQISLKRTWSSLGFWQRAKVMTQLTGSIFVGDDLDEEDIEKLRDSGNLSDLMSALAEALPTVKGTLIDERDAYMAEKLRQSAGPRTVAVVGAGHLPGITGLADSSCDLEELERLPEPPLWPRIVKWALPILIIALLAYGFVQGGAERGVESIYLWILINGSLSALGAAIALGHPLTIAAAFAAAPLTSLNPFIAAGWVAGLVQALLRRPLVADMENLADSLGSVRGFWSNRLTRVLLVVVLSNLGSVLGTAVALPWIAARAF
ncbi:MAG: TraB/GumN family protein [Acidobacteriota bacterium]|nr:TraB/GumN family protein [Acidobacteriota bacterium]MDE2921621.1 TraB/GumN family protein [Acidobacteriota bacterium]MDE3266536.1 TraB/GumN family protein [Acidobacteriota bacterium]